MFRKQNVNHVFFTSNDTLYRSINLWSVDYLGSVCTCKLSGGFHNKGTFIKVTQRYKISVFLTRPAVNIAVNKIDI